MDAKAQIEEALEEMRTALRACDDEMLWTRAKAYWWAHIRCALDNDHEYLGGSMFTMQDTINELEGREEG